MTDQDQQDDHANCDEDDGDARSSMVWEGGHKNEAACKQLVTKALRRYERYSYYLFTIFWFFS
jgi:hypothetical protein